MQGSPTTGHDEVQTLQFHRYESAAGRVRPRWSLRNDHNIFGYGHGIEGSKQYECTHWANVQWTLWQVCNPCHSLYPMFQLCIIKFSTAVNPTFLLWSRPHLLLEVNSLQMQIGLACAWGLHLAVLTPPRRPAFSLLFFSLFQIFISELICLANCTGTMQCPISFKLDFSTNLPLNSLFATYICTTLLYQL